MNYNKRLSKLKRFDKKDKSKFNYWFYHWYAYQLVALKLGVWKFKYLFHDFEKPWLKLFLSYADVKKWHKTHRKHHIEYGVKNGFNNVDWEAAIIDWECSRYTKKFCPLNARQETERILRNEKLKYTKYELSQIRKYALKTLKDLCL